MVTLPRIALVGRPNVGKSTLFNRICGRRKAIIDSRPGSTRDRNYAQTSWQGSAFELIDTGGLLLQTDDPLLGPASDQAERAIAESDLVLLVVDGRAGLLPDDAAIAARLRKSGKRVIVAVNKIEGSDDVAAEFTRLGFDAVVPISAEHGLGVGDLLDTALAQVPKVEAAEDEEAPLKLAIVGRPNVGKSSLLNRFVGQERAVVSAVPGTTRDSVDSLLEKDGKRYLFVDTAGIRRSRLLKENVDHVSVVQARRALERADVAILVLDATEGMREMDATIGGYALEAGRPTVIVVNKWDEADARGLKQKKVTEDVRDHLKFLPWAKIIYTSAKTGRGLTAILLAAEKAAAAGRQRMTTGQLNRFLAEASQRFPPKAMKGNQPVKILFGTQIGISPPTYALSLNHPVDLHFSYRRYLENQLRETLDLEGTPVVIKVRTRKH
ncbi:MAG TPA: ribosome biogenesis GTPase Der [Vicinamibacteria bacterium]|nr:ribosome biogenesis GTPase Der [Vicinamibacteria bacterium]